MFGLALASTVHRLERELTEARNELARQQGRQDHLYTFNLGLTLAVEKLTERCKALLGAHETSPTTLAELFSELGDKEQAAFFNHVGRLTDAWETVRCMQWGAMTRYLDNDGREVLVELGQYGEPLPPEPPPAQVIEKNVFEAMRSLAEEHGRKMFGVELICEASSAHHINVREALYSLHCSGKVVLNELPPDANDLHRIQSAGLSLEVSV